MEFSGHTSRWAPRTFLVLGLLLTAAVITSSAVRADGEVLPPGSVTRASLYAEHMNLDDASRLALDEALRKHEPAVAAEKIKRCAVREELRLRLHVERQRANEDSTRLLFLELMRIERMITSLRLNLVEVLEPHLTPAQLAEIYLAETMSMGERECHFPPFAPSGRLEAVPGQR